MPDLRPNALVSEDDLKAALAEVDALSDAASEAIPDLDPTAVVVVPVPQAQPELARSDGARPAGPLSQPSPDADEADTGDAGDASAAPSAHLARALRPWRAVARLARRIRPRRRREAAASEAPRQPVPAAPTRSLGQRLYELVDGALELTNRPFAWLGPAGRQTVGILAIITLILSLAAPILAPRVAARRDALSLLREKRAALDNARPNPGHVPEPSGGRAESSGGH